MDEPTTSTQSLQLVKRKGRPRKTQVPPSPMIGGYRDQPLIESREDPSFTLPIQEMTPEQYEQEKVYPGSAAYRRYIKSLDLDELKFALAHYDTPKAVAFLAALADPRNREVDIVAVAQKFKIGFNELMAVWRNSRLTRAMSELFDGAPAVARDTVEDARSTVACCPRCDGAGVIKVNRNEVQEWIECMNCEGTGTVRKTGDAKSRAYVFKATGLVKDAPNMVINNNVGRSGVDSVLDDLERPGSTVIDASIVEES